MIIPIRDRECYERLNSAWAFYVHLIIVIIVTSRIRYAPTSNREIMIKLLKSSALATLLSFSASAVTQANEGLFGMGEDLNLFVGVDAQGRSMGFDDNFGDNLFAKNFGQYDVYGGLRLFRYFGLMLGYEKTSNKERSVVINEGERYLGVLIEPGDGIQSRRSHTEIKGTHFDLMGFYPICPRYDIDLFATVGLVRNKLKLDDLLYAVDGFTLPNPIFRHYDKKKTMARLSAGAQITFFEHIGIRAMVGWENTSKFKDLRPEEPTALQTFVKTKNSFIYGIGAFLTT